MPTGGGSSTTTQQLPPEIAALLSQAGTTAQTLYNNVSNNPGGSVAPFGQDTLSYFNAVRGLTAPDNSVYSQQFKNIGTGATNIADFYSGIPDYYNNATDASAQDYFSKVMGGAENLQGIQGAYAKNYGYDPVSAASVANANITSAADNFSPYLGLIDSNLINPTLANFDAQTSRGLNSLRAGRDAGYAFGDRSRNADAVYMGEADRNRAALEAQLRSSGLTQAFGLGGSDADRLAQSALQGTSLEAQRLENNANRAQTAVSDFAAGANATDQFNASQSLAAQQFNRNLAAQNIQNRLGTANTLNSNAFNLANARSGNALNVAAGRTGTAQNNILNMLSSANAGSSLNQQGFANTLAQLGLLQGIGGAQDSRAQSVLDAPGDAFIKYILGTIGAGTGAGGSSTTRTSGSLANTAALAGGAGGLAAGVAQLWPLLAACWVAREVYGTKTNRWKKFRSWLYAKSPIWFTRLYLKYGERIAAYISDKPKIKDLIRGLMDTKIAEMESCRI